MTATRIAIKRLDSAEDTGICARMMADSEPWISLERGFEESFEIVSEPSRAVYVAWLKEDLVGFIIVEMTGSFIGYIKSMCVSPEHRGKGIGSMLMKHAEEGSLEKHPTCFY